jgi:hypothetical protein
MSVASGTAAIDADRISEIIRRQLQPDAKGICRYPRPAPARSIVQTAPPMVTSAVARGFLQYRADQQGQADGRADAGL